MRSRGSAVGELGEDAGGSPGAPVGRDLGLLEPGAVGVLPEVVARLDGGVHPGEVHAGAGTSSISLGRERGCQEQNQGEKAEARHGVQSGGSWMKDIGRLPIRDQGAPECRNHVTPWNV